MGEIVVAFFLGQLIGLTNLGSILKKHYILSNHEQIKYTAICKKLTPSILLKMYEESYNYQLSNKLQSLLAKDPSALSRELVTVVLDDSIFKHILTITDATDEETKSCYSAFYSGQYKSVVLGFKVLTLAIVIDGLLYPLFFELVPKEEKLLEKKKKKKEKKELKQTKKKEKLSQKNVAQNKVEEIVKNTSNEIPEGISVKDSADNAIKLGLSNGIKYAEILINRYGLWKDKLQKKGIILPQFYFSCDNGYSHKSLSEVCLKNGLKYISVPKKNQCFEIDNKKQKISTFIDEVFLIEEKKYNEKHKDKQDDIEAFTMRKKAIYCAQKQPVVLLIFRLNGSNKVSVIYATNNVSIFAKTLRRHWFNRTYIEQFFKTLKHVLRIQEARTKTKSTFEVKLHLFSFLAWHLQNLIRVIRNKVPDFAKKGISSLQIILAFDSDIPDLLQEILLKKQKQSPK